MKGQDGITTRQYQLSYLSQAVEEFQLPREDVSSGKITVSDKIHTELLAGQQGIVHKVTSTDCCLGGHV
jgi:hypothetical protein